MLPGGPLTFLALAAAALAPPGAGPVLAGDPDAPDRLGGPLDAAVAATGRFAPLPPGPWAVRLHLDDAAFEAATGAPPQRAAAWVGDTLHLRPWAGLARRDLGALLRHELVHRRLGPLGLPRWREEAQCLWAEGHTRPPDRWPPDPEPAVQARLDRALAAGTSAAQAWAYAWLRAWLGGNPAPAPPPAPPGESWEPEAAAGPMVRVTWPPERLPRVLRVEGEELAWRPGFQRTWRGAVRFGPPAPCPRLDGEVRLRAVAGGWSLTWSVPAQTWIAAAAQGELGPDAPPEALRALAAVLARWLEGHRQGQHPGGSLCPLTHCAVVRGSPSAAALAAAAARPELALDPRRAHFSASLGGVALSPREVWGEGPDRAGRAVRVPGDKWADWRRTLAPAQVRALKAAVPPGLAPGQRGLALGPSGPYPVERLRLEAGRRFGWTAWPSNACSATVDARGALHLTGHGLGHNSGLCLTTAIHLARQGMTAEAILAQAFPE